MVDISREQSLRAARFCGKGGAVSAGPVSVSPSLVGSPVWFEFEHLSAFELFLYSLID